MGETAQSVEQNGQKFKGCGCACGKIVNGKSRFLQGHDARLVSLSAKWVAGGETGQWIGDDEVPGWVVKSSERDDDMQVRIDRLAQAFRQYASDPLATKVWDAAMRLWGKGAGTDKEVRRIERAAAKEAKAAQAPTQVAAGTLKVGRWTYPAVKMSDGVVHFTKANGDAGVATPDQAAKFRVGLEVSA